MKTAILTVAISLALAGASEAARPLVTPSLKIAQGQLVSCSWLNATERDVTVTTRMYRNNAIRREGEATIPPHYNGGEGNISENSLGGAYYHCSFTVQRGGRGAVRGTIYRRDSTSGAAEEVKLAQ